MSILCTFQVPGLYVWDLYMWSKLVNDIFSSFQLLIYTYLGKYFTFWIGLWKTLCINFFSFEPIMILFSSFFSLWKFGTTQVFLVLLEWQKCYFWIDSNSSTMVPCKTLQTQKNGQLVFHPSAFCGLPRRCQSRRFYDKQHWLWWLDLVRKMHEYQIGIYTTACCVLQRQKFGMCQGSVQNIQPKPFLSKLRIIYSVLWG